MSPGWIAAVAPVLMVGAALAQEPPSAEKKALEGLRGDWKMTDSSTFNIQALDGLPEGLFPRDGRVRFDGDKLFFGEKLKEELTVQLGALGGKTLMGFVVPKRAGVAAVGVYELDKDTLKVCLVVRGLADKCGPNRGGVSFEFKRVEK